MPRKGFVDLIHEKMCSSFSFGGTWTCQFCLSERLPSSWICYLCLINKGCFTWNQRIFQGLVIGGFGILFDPQTKARTIPGIFSRHVSCQLGDYMLPITFSQNLKNLLMEGYLTSKKKLREAIEGSIIFSPEQVDSIIW